MSIRQRIIAVFVLVTGLVISGCGPSPALAPTPTMGPLAPTPAPPVTQVSVPTEIVTPPPTPITFVTEASVSLAIEGIYNIKGIAPDGKPYSSKLTITLKSDNPNSSNKQPVYYLAWDNGSAGAGILIKDARETSFLATSFGGSGCGAIFYSIDSSTLTLTGTWLKLGTMEIGSEIESPTVLRSTLEGDYNVVGYNAIGSEYKGTLSITRQGMENVWQLAWNVGQPHNGIGISLNKSLFAAAFGGESCGVSVFEVKNDGSLHATWTVWASNQIGEETATKK
jgi:hypothetical protein